MNCYVLFWYFYECDRKLEETKKAQEKSEGFGVVENPSFRGIRGFQVRKGVYVHMLQWRKVHIYTRSRR